MIPESGSTLELGGPGGTGYSTLMRDKPKPTNARPMGAMPRVAAAMSGIGQGVMGGKMAKAFNAGAGGYQDLYRAKAYPEALHQQMSGPAPDDPQNEYAELKKQLMQKRAGAGQVQSPIIPQGGSAL